MDSQESKKLTRSKINRQCKMNSFVLTGNQNPFLNPFIVERILEFCKLHNQDATFFPSLRLVSQLWNEECTKLLRQETQIPVTRLLEPFPEGLGWTLNRCHLTTGFKHQYKCPVPPTREFENFQFTATCESFKDRRAHRWFYIMGGQAKSLHFISALTCFHQNDFLANILFKWCPNLETLDLDGIQCFHSLLYMFEGKLNEFSSLKNSPIICKNLKSLTISVENDKEFHDCKCKPGRVPEAVYLKNKETLKYFLGDIKEILKILPEMDRSGPSQIANLFHRFVQTNNPALFSKFLSQYERMNGIDWGVLGHILKSAPLQKVVIKSLLNKSQTEDLITFLVCQPNQLRSTLEHLEFQNASVCRNSLSTLSLLKFPLTTLVIDNILWRSGTSNCLRDILKNCADTLVNFKVGVEIIIFGSHNQVLQYALQVPVLPKLKSFTNKTFNLLQFSGFDLFQNTPNLEKCCIQNLRCDANTVSERQVTAEALRKFLTNLDDPDMKEHPLKDLKMQVYIESSQVNFLKRGIPNLVNVEFNIVDPLNLLLTYPNSNGWDNLESLKLSIGNVDGLNDIERISDEDAANCFRKFQNLKFFDLTFDSDGMGFLPLAVFTNGFSKLTMLQSLKFTNLCLLSDEKDEIIRSIERIPFISFSGTRVIPREHFRQMIIPGNALNT